MHSRQDGVNGSRLSISRRGFAIGENYQTADEASKMYLMVCKSNSIGALMETEFCKAVLVSTNFQIASMYWASVALVSLALYLGIRRTKNCRVLVLRACGALSGNSN